MSRPEEFSFSGDSVAASYDDVLVPLLFTPWAECLVSENGPWNGQSVLDLATGTGIVAQFLADQVGSDGRVTALDINAAMLARARTRCAQFDGRVEFVESSAHPLPFDDGSFDTVVCQQGFQFFPDQPAAVAEMHRVLRPGGRVLASCWLGVDRCEFFGSICTALDRLGHEDIADLMRVPFLQCGNEMRDHFESGGFQAVKLHEAEHPMVFESVEQAVSAMYATPIAPRLCQLDESTQAKVRAGLAKCFEGFTQDERVVGNMATTFLVAIK